MQIVNFLGGLIPVISILTVILFPILLVAFVAYPIYYYFKIHRKIIADETEKIKNSEEYKNQCSSIDAENTQNQKKLNQAYMKEMKEYQETIMPKYKHELQIWTDQHNAKITQVQNDLDGTKSELSDLYNTTKILPVQYQNIQALEYIHGVLSTSDYDVKAAIEMYDRNEQRKLDMARLQEQRIANQQAADQNALLNEQNYLLDEQNAIADKARKQANAAAIVGAVQRHNTNKSLKNLRR